MEKYSETYIVQTLQEISSALKAQATALNCIKNLLEDNTNKTINITVNGNIIGDETSLQQFVDMITPLLIERMETLK